MQIIVKRTSRPWWVILLLTPLLVSCFAGPIAIWEVALQIGGYLACTATGEVIEQVVDRIFEKYFHESSYGHVILDPGNPLQGTYSTKMTFTATDSAGQTKTFEINQPRMYRDSETSPWQLTPDLRELVKQEFKNGD